MQAEAHKKDALERMKTEQRRVEEAQRSATSTVSFSPVIPSFFSCCCLIFYSFRSAVFVFVRFSLR
jgi:hypothetical protein